MPQTTEHFIISGIQEDGKKLRPTDWVERISSTLASFDENHRLHYSVSVQPCLIDGDKCLVVARCLEETNPAAYEFVMEFARSNKLRILPDRRTDERALPCAIPPAPAGKDK
ncbi:MAG: DUF3579 domain-containing protein [Hydrogenophilales bacterium]|nr:DUF3579 domain-containing protein [Hydrogenophilales bacterium]